MARIARKRHYNRASREVWYIGDRAPAQRADMARFRWPDMYASEGHTFVYVWSPRGCGRWMSFEAPFTDLEIRSEGKRYPYMLYPAGAY